MENCSVTVTVHSPEKSTAVMLDLPTSRFDKKKPEETSKTMKRECNLLLSVASDIALR